MCSRSISASQIKAARALLDWPQDQLAAFTGISIATIRRIESGYISPRHSTTGLIKECLENAGIEFTEYDGVCRRNNEITVFEGAGGRDFFTDMTQTTQMTGKSICLLMPKASIFAGFCGLQSIFELDKLIGPQLSVEVQCLLTEEDEPLLSTPRFQFRTLSKSFINPIPFCVYGDKYAVTIPNGQPICKLIVVNSAKMAAAGRDHFRTLWEKTAPHNSSQSWPAKRNIA